MRVTIVGMGYVGLVTGACFADFGHDVICIDNDVTKIDKIKSGIMPIYEPGLSDLVRRNIDDGRLSFEVNLTTALENSEVVFISVGTPSRRGDGHADLTYVYAAAREIAQSLKGYAAIVIKSTVPIGTGDEVERIIRSARPELDVAIVSNPEFLREGAAIDDFMRPDRIVVGIEEIDGAPDERTKSLIAEIYRPLFLNKSPILFTNRRTSELIKYAANAFLATKITFINEIADLCEQAGANVQKVAEGIGLDNRIGPKFLHAGPGFGGSCFPKDARALVRIGQENLAPLRIVEAVISVNENRKRSMARKVASVTGDLRGKTVGILGLTFKPETDDMREAPSIPLIQGLVDRGAIIQAYDPAGMHDAGMLLSDVTFTESAYKCAEGADVLVIVTEWAQFRALDFPRLKQIMRKAVLVDLRNIYSVDEIEAHGFVYRSVGR